MKKKVLSEILRIDNLVNGETEWVMENPDLEKAVKSKILSKEQKTFTPGISKVNLCKYKVLPAGKKLINDICNFAKGKMSIIKP